MPGRIARGVAGWLPRVWWILALVFVVIAVALGVLAWNQYTLDRGWEETTGVVVGVLPPGSGHDTIIRFQDSDHIEYEFNSEFGSGSTREGTEVTVRYDPRNPSDARAAGDSGAAAVGIGVGSLVALVAAGFSGLRATGRIKGAATARGMLVNAQNLYGRGRRGAAIAVLDEVIAGFGDSTDPALAEVVASARQLRQEADGP